MVSFKEIAQGQVRIAVVGLGYLGLPLAAAFGQHVSFQLDKNVMESFGLLFNAL